MHLTWKPGVSTFRVVNEILHFSTRGEIEFIDLTERVKEAVLESRIANGFVHVFAPHATGIVILTENDPGLLLDLKNLLRELVPENRSYNHPSNAHAHLRSVLFPPDKTIPAVDGKVEFGTWQSLFFVETDVYPRRRKIIVQIVGE